jgi:hypothetical protein
VTILLFKIFKTIRTRTPTRQQIHTKIKLTKVSFAFGMGPKQEFFIQSANYYFYYFCIGMAQNKFFTSANPNILPWYLLLFPLWSQLPQCQPNIFDPHALLYFARRSAVMVKQGQGCGV